jgi:hypothetical protein
LANVPERNQNDIPEIGGIMTFLSFLRFFKLLGLGRSPLIMIASIPTIVALLVNTRFNLIIVTI